MSSGKQANDEWMGTNTSTNTINNTKTKTNTNICPLENKLMKNRLVHVLCCVVQGDMVMYYKCIYKCIQCTNTNTIW